MPRDYTIQSARNAGEKNYAVEDRGHETPCWIWRGAVWPTGYAAIRVDGQTRRAHRLIYEAEVGPIPKGKDLDHLCRNRACVNPDHLEPVTRAENCRRGDHTKLTPDQVAEIKKVDRDVSSDAVGALYGVSGRCIRSIWRGETWR